MLKHDPDPPNPPLSFNNSNEFTKSHKKIKKKPDKSLKPKKTTRTINSEPKVVMKHGKLLSSRQVNVKEVGTNSWAKEGVPGIIDEGMEDGFDKEESMEADDDVTDNGLVSEKNLGDKEVRDKVGNRGSSGNGCLAINLIPMAYERSSFARVLIKVNATDGIVDNVEIWGGMYMGRGGFSSRGRGSIYGRGGFNNVQVNNGKRYVHVKNMAKEKTSDVEGMKRQEVDKEAKTDQATHVKHIAKKLV
nr:hypothetical protein [Tanacetum cinerariifolium]